MTDLFSNSELSNDSLLSIKSAAKWASGHLNKHVTAANISYLVNYGRIQNRGELGEVLVDRNELEKYYKSYHGERELSWKERLGSDLNWALSFDNYKESQTTKHVHRLHPYKGKFIPQLVEYFLDDHIDEFKKEVFFKKGDIVIDPFCGSGTTLVQANELGLHALGIDISTFNAEIANAKTTKYELVALKHEIDIISDALIKFNVDRNIIEFEEQLLSALREFNNEYFPTPDYRYKVAQKLIDENVYGEKHTEMFLPVYNDLVEEYAIKLTQEKQDSFIDQWYLQVVRDEIDLVNELISTVANHDLQTILKIIFSRTIRSCRATTHSDLATLKYAVTEPYYCKKHGKICKPLFSILKRWKNYSSDTIRRLDEYNSLKTETFQHCFPGNSQSLNIEDAISTEYPDLEKIYQDRGISGVFSSPPYVGIIDYHEQHAYAYSAFNYKRNDDAEIGPKSKGQSQIAIKAYVKGIANVLVNCRKYLKEDYNIFLVANDKHRVYPEIAARAGMEIVNEYKRPVLNRTERDRTAYSETIFHLKEGKTTMSSISDSATKAITNLIDSKVNDYLGRAKASPKANSGNPFVKTLMKDFDPLVHRIHGLKTAMGNQLEKIAEILAVSGWGPGNVIHNDRVNITLPSNVFQTIDTILNLLSESKNIPDYPAEKQQLIEAIKNPSPTSETHRYEFDLSIYDPEANHKYYIEMKGADPNTTEIPGAKKRLLSLMCHAFVNENVKDADCILAIYYNNQFPNEYSNPKVKGIFDLHDGVFVQEDFWNFLGKDNHTYTDLLEIFETYGDQNKQRILEGFSALLR